GSRGRPRRRRPRSCRRWCGRTPPNCPAPSPWSARMPCASAAEAVAGPNKKSKDGTAGPITALGYLLEVRQWDVAKILRWSAWQQERKRHAADNGGSENERAEVPSRLG